MRLITVMLLLVAALCASAAEQKPLNSSQQACYATAMIGYDYVINSRAGLPIERALKTVTVNVNAENVYDVYKFQLHNVVINAYDWMGNPHTYAAKVMYDCAFSQARKLNGLQS